MVKTQLKLPIKIYVSTNFIQKLLINIKKFINNNIKHLQT